MRGLIVFVLALLLLVLAATVHLVFGQQYSCVVSLGTGVTLVGRYSTPGGRCYTRSVTITMYAVDNTTVEVAVEVEGMTYRHRYAYTQSISFEVAKTSDDPNTGMVVIQPFYVVLCESLFCTISGSGCSGTLELPPPNCEEDNKRDDGGNCSCNWWNIVCWLRCIFSWVINSILSVLGQFFNWLRDQIVNLLPQPIKDFFAFMGQLFGFLGQLIVQMINYLPYFLFTLGLVFAFGLVYYVVEYGVVGIGMYFEMLYDLFKKFIELIIKVLDTIIPF